MYLTDGIRTLDDETFPMAGLIPGVSAMRGRLQALGYVEVETSAPSILGPAGTRWRGHQFRYSVLEAAGAKKSDLIFRVVPRWGGEAYSEGYRVGNVVASYVHAHWASNPASRARLRLGLSRMACAFGRRSLMLSRIGAPATEIWYSRLNNRYRR